MKILHIFRKLVNNVGNCDFLPTVYSHSNIYNFATKTPFLWPLNHVKRFYLTLPIVHMDNMYFLFLRASDYNYHFMCGNLANLILPDSLISYLEYSHPSSDRYWKLDGSDNLLMRQKQQQQQRKEKRDDDSNHPNRPIPFEILRPTSRAMVGETFGVDLLTG
jgi:hypothetical protein